jgi:hypothetical protein
MLREEFMIQVEKSFLRSKSVLLRKERHYALDGKDRLSQFKRLGLMEGKKPTEVLFTLMDKHISSIADMVKYPEDFNKVEWHEKTTDLRNYTFLLDALLVDLEII